MTSEEYLSHYGREGMKWYEHIFGKFQEHAKYNKEKRTAKKEEKKQKKQDQKELTNKMKKALKKSNYKKLSNEELKSRIDRMKIEKEYLDLKRDTRTKGKRIMDNLLNALGEVSMDVAKGSIRNIGQQYVTWWVGTKINDQAVKKGMQAIVNPKKGQKDK